MVKTPSKPAKGKFTPRHGSCSSKRTLIKNRLRGLTAQFQQFQEKLDEMAVEIYALSVFKDRILEETDERWLQASIKRAEKIQYDDESDDCCRDPHS